MAGNKNRPLYIRGGRHYDVLQDKKNREIVIVKYGKTW